MKFIIIYLVLIFYVEMQILPTHREEQGSKKRQLVMKNIYYLDLIYTVRDKRSCPNKGGWKKRSARSLTYSRKTSRACNVARADDTEQYAPIQRV